MKALLGGLFSSGHAVDLILAVIAGEFAFLAWRSARRRRRGGIADIALALAPGACLLLALRAALTGATWWWMAGWLAVSFPVHLTDLARRKLFD